jgi:phosphocarrier protein
MMMHNPKTGNEEDMKIDVTFKKVDGKKDIKIREEIPGQKPTNYHEKINGNRDVHFGSPLEAMTEGESMKLKLHGADLTSTVRPITEGHYIEPKIVEEKREKHRGFYHDNGYLCFDAMLRNKLGLHARASDMLVQAINDIPEYQGDVYIDKEGSEADARSIIMLLTLAAEHGSKIKVKAQDAPYAKEVLEKVHYIIDTKFGED